MKTAKIKYNLKDRGRQYRGKERRFNIKAIVDSINGAECQERVKNRDMLGYYGHWPRVKFGMNPAEGGLDDGRPSVVEPALVTTHLHALDDGTIEHEAEFLGTDSGQVAAKLYASRTGGFSSAIDQIKPEFFGFDYVLEPNYSTNRGYTLDDVSGMSAADIDAAIYDEEIRGMMRLLDAAHVERERANGIIEHLRAENEQLLSMLATPEEIRAFDSAKTSVVATGKDPMRRLQRDAEFFRTAALPQVDVKGGATGEVKMPDLYYRMMDRFR